MEEKINAARLTDDRTGEVYELDFSRESISFAEKQGFSLEKAVDFPVTGLRDLFYYSFRKNHRRLSREKTDNLFDRWGGGIPEGLAKRLALLYSQAQNSNAIVSDEDAGKNAEMTLEL